MELLTTWTAVLAIVLGLALFLSTFLLHGHHRCSRVYNLPPGPKPWPLIGNINLIMGELPHRSIHDLSKRYGPLMQLRYGSLPVIIVASAKMAKHILKINDSVFADRPRFAIGKYTAYDCCDMLWSPFGSYLRQARRICTSELFSTKRLESFKHIRDEEVRVMLRDLHRASGRIVRLRDHLQMLTLGVISRIVLGRKYIEEEAAGEGGSPPVMTPADFREMMDEFFVLNGAFNIGDFIPWLDWLDLQGYIRRMKAISAMFDRFLEHVLDVHNMRRLLEGERFVAKDTVDVLLQLADDPNLEVQLSRDNVKAITQDLITGATDTTPNTMEWALSELLKNPKILAKATEELNHVIGLDRLVTEKDLSHLPYIEAVLKETMRMHPAAPMLAPHQAVEDACVDGYDILAGTVVFINVWGISRDPALWDAPEEFRPERFLESKIGMRGQDFELLPFGSGRRMCPGYGLALRVMTLGLANLLHGFVWRLPEGVTVEDLSMEETFQLVMPRKFPLEVTVEPRLPARLYMGASRDCSSSWK
ncbi:flavonoid 3' [Panicum miliaceum]|uniref:Flavonoid 3 n=1 Tax=Panicum miliaceum TaxID=4540 RepID=A0A3L6T6F4_PANMI|nr:flavonoid 3' [Panicum miliaceum]